MPVAALREYAHVLGAAEVCVRSVSRAAVAEESRAHAEGGAD